MLLLGTVLPVDAASLNRCLACHSRVLLSHDFVTGSPVVLAACTACHGGNDQTSRKDLAHFNRIDGRYAWFLLTQSPPMVEARQAVDQFACRRCHIQDKQGNPLATSLDPLRGRRPVPEIRQALLQPAYYMPAFALGERDLERLIRAVLGGVNPATDTQTAEVTVVHFEEPDAEQRPFEKHCGACHRVLTAHAGGLGTATVTPNLSGLLSPFYPKNFKDQEAWTADGLVRWIKNPRQIRPLAVMPPLTLSDQQIHELIETTWPTMGGETRK